MEKSNLYYCHRETIEEVCNVLNDPSVSFFTKDIIEKGLNKDCLDAVKYVELALNALKVVEKDISNYDECKG